MSRPRHPGMAHLLFFLSGLAGLAQEVLWRRELALVFGSTAAATAAVLTAFFVGLGVGALWGGRVAERVRRPLAAYGLLEVGVAVAAVLGLLLVRAHPVLYASVADASPWVRDGARLLLALVSVGPAAALLGATFPMIARYVIPETRTLGRRGSLLYAVNTIGAATGALLAGFVLPAWLGYRGAWALVLGVTACLGFLAWMLGRSEVIDTSARSAEQGTPRRVRWSLGALAFATGFLALAIEVLWIRAATWTLPASAYTFAMVLALFLIGLGVAGLLASLLARLDARPRVVLGRLALLAAVLVLFSRSGFGAFGLVEDAGTKAVGETFLGYLLGTALTVGMAVLPLAAVIGALFPYLLRVAEALGMQPGRAVGRLAGWNVLGGALGAPLAGFVLVPALGTGLTIGLVAGGYAALAVLLSWRRAYVTWTVSLFLALLFGVLLLGIHLGALPHGRVGKRIRGTEVWRTWSGPTGTVAVVRKIDLHGEDDVWKLRYQGGVVLGGSDDSRWEALQTHVALGLHRAPRRVFYLGLGTGITAGASLDHPVEQVEIAEIVPEVVNASRRYFRRYANGLFANERVTIHTDDGRHRLRWGTSVYDVVVGDLFFPWEEGAASLYTREHFEAVKTRLAEGGAFVQWLPAFQVSEETFRGLARTMTSVFDQVTLWRGDFASRRPLLALVGHRAAQPLDPDALVRRAASLGGKDETGLARWSDSLPFFFYVGNVGAADRLFDAAPLHTDDDPWIQWRGARTWWARAAGRDVVLAGPRLLAFETALRAAVPPDEDPYLARLTRAQRRRVRAGLALRAVSVHGAQMDSEGSRRALLDYVRLVPEAERPPLESWID